MMKQFMTRGMLAVCAVATLFATSGSARAKLISGPTARTVDGQTVIRFEVRAATDVEVSVLDGEGRVVRHLAAGVLGGEHAPPAPLRPGLAQSITWDGRDDAGRPATGGPFKARVRVGLRARFDRFLGASAENQGTPVGLGCDPAGNLYVISTWVAPNQHYPGMEIKSFDRQGRYRRQIMPYPASLPPERLTGVERIELPDGTSVPLVYHGGNHSLYPQSGAASRQSVVVRPDGKLATTNAIMGDLPYGFSDAERRVVVLGADGSVGDDYLGPLVARNQWRGGSYVMLALSPDGETIYAAGYRDQGVPVPVVTRTTWDAPGEPEIFLGDPENPGAAPHGLVEPRGLAVDPQGNLYVCDNAAGRIAVFSAAGQLLGRIPVEHPDLVAVHRKTGAVYVLTIRPDPQRNRDPARWGQGHNWYEGKRLLRFDGLEATTPSAAMDLPTSPAKTLFCLDDSRDEAAVWIGQIKYGDRELMRVVDRGDAFGPPEYPIRDRVPEGAAPIGYLDLTVDPHTEEVVVGKAAAERYDGRTGEHLGRVLFENARQIPGADWGELEFAFDGRTLLHQTGHESLFRFDRRGSPVPWPGRRPNERAPHEVAGDLPQGFMHSRGLAAAPDGGFFVLHHEDHRTFNNGRVSHVGPDGSIVRGEIVRSDVPVGGIRVGRAGHIYVGVHLKPAGRLLPDWFSIFPGGHIPPAPEPPEGWGAEPGQLPPGPAPWYVEQYGSLVKFRPEGGRLVFEEDGPYFAPNVGGEHGSWTPDWRTARGSVRAEGVEWTWYGLAPMPSRRGTSRHLGGPRCSCQTPRFDLDGHERVYLPDPYRFGVAVLDAAGNLITRFGQYGNQDDPGGGDVIPLGWVHAVAASREAVYAADMVNHRLVRVRLEAAAEASCDVAAP
jgi:hypothetical protein